jgi:serine/threonine protein kinase
MIPSGSIIGGYTVGKLLHEGMTKVYSATDTKGHKIALKVVNRHDRAYKDVVQHEQRGAQLQRFICKELKDRKADRVCPDVYPDGEDGDWYYVPVEFVEGTTLHDTLQKSGPFSANKAALIGSRILDLLGKIHSLQYGSGGERGEIAHRDIKPDNIMLLPGDRPLLLDFGIARVESKKITAQPWGYSPYMSPERLRQNSSLPHVDLWSMGIVLYEMLTGRTPWEQRRGEELFQFASRIETKKPPDNSLDAPAIPEALRAIVKRALDFEISRRYASAPDFADALRDYLRQGRKTTPIMKPAAPVSPPVSAHPAAAVPQPAPAIPQPGVVQPVVAGQLGAAVQPIPTPPAPSPQPVAPVLGGRISRVVKKRVVKLGAVTLLVLVCLSFVVGSAVTRESAANQQISAVIEDARKAGADLDTADLLARLKAALETTWLPTFLSPAKQMAHRIPEDMRTRTDGLLELYRGDPKEGVSNTAWSRAREELRIADAVEPENRETKARLALIDGFSLTQSALALPVLKDGTRTAFAQQRLRQAETEFRTAAGLMPKSCDPYLGLARLYAYGMPDLEKLTQAHESAAAREYKLSSRETAQRADAHSYIARQSYLAAMKSTDVKDQIDALSRAQDHVGEALRFYSEIPTYRGSAKLMQRCRDLHRNINMKLNQLGR